MSWTETCVGDNVSSAQEALEVSVRGVARCPYLATATYNTPVLLDERVGRLYPSANCPLFARTVVPLILDYFRVTNLTRCWTFTLAENIKRRVEGKTSKGGWKRRLCSVPGFFEFISERWIWEGRRSV